MIFDNHFSACCGIAEALFLERRRTPAIKEVTKDHKRWGFQDFVWLPAIAATCGPVAATLRPDECAWYVELMRRRLQTKKQPEGR